MPDFMLPLDARLVFVALLVFFSGIAKGVTGIGIPIVAVPLLVAVYGDLRTALLVTVLATALSDIPLVWRYRERWRDASMLVGFMIAGMIGIVIGTRILLVVKTPTLAAILAVVVAAYLAVNVLGRMPMMSPALARRTGPLFGLIGGVLQGAAGQSGPVTTIYLASTRMSREAFLFSINLIFLVLDFTLLVSLESLGLSTAGTWIEAVAILAITFGGIGIGFGVQRRIDDRIFRRTVLAMLAVAALGLVYRAVRG